MGAPAEMLEEIFTVIQGGQTIGESAEIIQFPSDNGARTFTAVNKTFQGTNGTGLNYWVSAVASGASALSAGALMITVSIPEFIAFAVPCLGIAVGTAFYNIDPEGWTNLALLITDAGWTIKNKVVGFMTEKGILNFPPETIEILKNELARLGAFEVGEEWEGDKPETFEIDKPVISSTKQVIIDINGTMTPVYYGGVYDDRESVPNVITGFGFTPTEGITDYKLTSAIVDGALICLICSKSPFTSKFYAYRISDLKFKGSGITGTPLEYTYDNKKVYYFYSNYFSDATNNPGLIDLGTNPDNLTSDELAGQVAWTLQYGDFIESYAEHQQKGAKFPQEGIPFRTTYPDWLPWEFPEIPGWSIPEAMPVQYPDLLPEAEPYQDPAQNPNADPDEEAEKGVDILEDPEKNPATENRPAPDQDPDPDPQPEPEEPLPEEDPIVNPDPIEPDPTPTPSPAIPVSPLPATVGSNKLFTVYNPTSTQLGQLGGYLWDDNLIEVLKKIWQNPLDGIISLIQVYVTPTTSGSSNIILGYLDSGVSSLVVSNQFKTIDCGTITLPELNENCLDYIPYTKLELYLPFIGITEIDTNEFMGGTITVTYKVDVYTGTCLAEVKCTRSRDLDNGAILYTFSGNCSQQIPLTSGDARGVFGALVSAVGLGLSVASGGATAMVAAGTVAGLAGREMLHVSHSGNLSANAGIMGQKKPYLIINRERPYTANSYNSFYGYPANKTINIGNYSGFLKVKSCKLKGSATEAEKQEIMQLLTTGIYA